MIQATHPGLDQHGREAICERQTLNIVSLWDDMYDAWLRNLALAPALWPRIGVVLQGTAIDGGNFSADVYLEVESLLDDSGNPVQPYPNTYVPPTT
jgi:hypothetical protein